MVGGELDMFENVNFIGDVGALLRRGGLYRTHILSSRK